MVGPCQYSGLGGAAYLSMVSHLGDTAPDERAVEICWKTRRYITYTLQGLKNSDVKLQALSHSLTHIRV